MTPARAVKHRTNGVVDNDRSKAALWSCERQYSDPSAPIGSSRLPQRWLQQLQACECGAWPWRGASRRLRPLQRQRCQEGGHRSGPKERLLLPGAHHLAHLHLLSSAQAVQLFRTASKYEDSKDKRRVHTISAGPLPASSLARRGRVGSNLGTVQQCHPFSLLRNNEISWRRH